MAAFCCRTVVPAWAETGAQTDALIVPEKRVGPIRNSLAEEKLIALLPEGPVKRDLFPIGEGFHLCGRPSAPERAMRSRGVGKQAARI